MLKAEHLNIFIAEKLFFKEINLELKPGEILHLVGPNGSGKSTLIETLLSLREEFSGSLLREFTNDDYGYLPQVAHQFPKIHLQLQDICGEEFSFYPKSLHHKHWHHASGGERKKTLIAKAMGEAKKLLVLDEPFNHLDQPSIEQVCEEIENISRQNVSVIYTGHNAALKNSTRCEVLQWKC